MGMKTMKKHDDELVDDIEELVERLLLQSATSVVWQTFEEALQKLDPESRRLLEAHFNGNSATQLSEQIRLSRNEIETWLKQSKKETQYNIRIRFSARH
jgi:DNA-directed RNA polymerase specialized sigma24 family protein